MHSPRILIALLLCVSTARAAPMPTAPLNIFEFPNGERLVLTLRAVGNVKYEPVTMLSTDRLALNAMFDPVALTISDFSVTGDRAYSARRSAKRDRWLIHETTTLISPGTSIFDPPVYETTSERIDFSVFGEARLAMEFIPDFPDSVPIKQNRVKVPIGDMRITVTSYIDVTVDGQAVVSQSHEDTESHELFASFYCSGSLDDAKCEPTMYGIGNVPGFGSRAKAREIAQAPDDTDTITHRFILDDGKEESTYNTVAAGVLFAANQMLPPPDRDFDGDVDGADFLIIQRFHPPWLASWQQKFGAGHSPAASSVPEPSALVLTVLAAGASGLRHVRKFRT